MKPKPLPSVAKREIIDGYLHTYDTSGRPCLDVEARQRVVLVHDLRVYGENLHIGALGWMVPETSDGYTYADVIFDTGQRLRLNRHAFSCVTVESASTVAAELIARYRRTRFDADPLVAASCREDWIAKYYGNLLALSETITKGTGDQEVYAYTFPSLVELAKLRGAEHYPLKVGYSKNTSDGSFGRIRSQILEKAGFPEKPTVLFMFKTWDGRHLETQLHQRLRSLGRKSAASLGREWFFSSSEELLHTIDECELSGLPPDRIITGADETIEEGFAALMANGAQIEMGMVPGQAAVSIAVRYPDKNAGQADASKQNTEIDSSKESSPNVSEES